MEVENATAQLRRLYSFVSSFDNGCYFVNILVKTFLNFTLVGENEFLIEVITVDVNGLCRINGTSHKYNSVLKTH